MGPDDRGGRLLVQQVARGLLRDDLLPHRLPQGELSGRVHGGGDLLRHVDKGQGPVLRQPLRRDGDRGAAARRQLLRAQLHRLRQLDPLRPRRGQERRPPGGRRDHGRARAGRAVRIDLGLLRPRRRSRRQQAGDRVPRQVRRPRLDRRVAARHARGAARGAGVGPEGPGRRAARPGLDLRLRRVVRGRGSARRRLCVPAPADPGRGVRPARAALARKGDARHVPLVAPARRRCARRSPRRSTARYPSSRRSRTAAWLTVGGIVAEAKKVRTRSGQLRHVREARRPRGTGRALHPRCDLGAGAGRRARPRRHRPRPARPQGARQDIASASRTPRSSSRTRSRSPAPRGTRSPRRSRSRSTPPAFEPS